MVLDWVYINRDCHPEPEIIGGKTGIKLECGQTIKERLEGAEVRRRESNYQRYNKKGLQQKEKEDEKKKERNEKTRLWEEKWSDSQARERYPIAK